VLCGLTGGEGDIANAPLPTGCEPKSRGLLIDLSMSSIFQQSSCLHNWMGLKGGGSARFLVLKALGEYYHSRKNYYLFSVDSRPIRKSFCLLSTGLHSWALNASAISTIADICFCLLDLKWALHSSHLPRAGRVRFMIRSLPLCMAEV